MHDLLDAHLNLLQKGVHTNGHSVTFSLQEEHLKGHFDNLFATKEGT